jgi:cell division protein FtsB
LTGIVVKLAEQALGEQGLNVRWIVAALLIATLSLQWRLWLSDDGYKQSRELRMASAEQRTQNEALMNRNKALEAEVLNLKHSQEAAEERARTNLGMIGKSETFYQVVPASVPDQQ